PNCNFLPQPFWLGGPVWGRGGEEGLFCARGNCTPSSCKWGCEHWPQSLTRVGLCACTRPTTHTARLQIVHGPIVRHGPLVGDP
uniref:Uncharacterized protein n=1 Tax=Naja naja TaxID=35670 RepID=A0A8C6VJL1_NAJNA